MTSSYSGQAATIPPYEKIRPSKKQIVKKTFSPADFGACRGLCDVLHEEYAANASILPKAVRLQTR
jgi:hypothetical protein